MKRRVCAIVGWMSLAAQAGPLTPTQSIEAMKLADPRLAVELVASEPAIEDPIAVAWDDDARMYVVEMRGFQQGPDAKGLPGLGRVTRFEDRDGDGRYESHTAYADDMYYPTAVMPAYGGIVVGCAPDIFFFRDTDGDGKADIRKIVYTGFGRENHEQLINSFQWGVDNWIHAASGQNGGKIRPGNDPGAKPIDIGTRNFRFRITPSGEPAGFETESGGGQFGLAIDDWGHVLTSSNSRHLIQIMLPEMYARRNPYLAAPQVAVDIPDHGAACKVDRISPLEEWRVVRTRQRAADPAYAKRLPPSELQPGGYITSGCGNSLYQADLLPADYVGQSFTCEPANNLIHRDRLSGDGPQLVASRIDADTDFLASTDNWFRPVTSATGPDGALYVVDMYREIIETPVSIPAEILKTINMDNGKDMGRVYRISPKEKATSAKPTRLSKLSNEQLVAELASANAWRRLTAQRLLVERQDAESVDAMERLATGESPIARLHALCTLDGLGELTIGTLRRACDDDAPLVRRTALRLAEPFLQANRSGVPASARAGLLRTVLARRDDDSPEVRYQLALTLSGCADETAVEALVHLARRDAGNTWIRTGVLLAIANRVPDFWQALTESQALAEDSEPNRTLVRGVAAIAGAHQQAFDWLSILHGLDKLPESQAWRVRAVLEGLATGVDRAGGKARLTGGDDYAGGCREVLLALMKRPGPTRTLAWQVAGRIEEWSGRPEADAPTQKALEVLRDSQAAMPERLAAIGFALRGDFEQVSPQLLELLTPSQPADLQKAIVTALAASGRPSAGSLLLERERWYGYTPTVRDAVIAATLSRAEYVPALLQAIEESYVPAWAIDASQRDRLTASKVEAIREKAKRLLQTPAGARDQVYERYKPALTMKGDASRGKVVFKTNCAACHRLEGVGSVVGPDLNGVRDRPLDQLLGDILIPSRTMTAGYAAFNVETEDGETLSGIIVSESATAITLKQREGVEKTILRSNISSVYASSLSMMPEDLDRTITVQQMADLLAYLKAPHAP